MNKKNMLWILSFIVTAISLTILVSYLVNIHRSYDPDETQLTDNKSVDTYLNSHWEQKKIAPEDRPFRIPTGVFVSSISWINARSFSISGYVWQKYPLNYPESLTKGFILPEITELEKRKVYNVKGDQNEIIGWYFEGRINQQFDYSKYPLDHKIVMLRLWHEDFNHDVVLTPDFDSYDSTLSADKFGLDPEIELGGYRILETFFRFRHTDYDTDFGLGHSEEERQFPELYYNIVLKRYAADALIVHVLPLIVVLILCFSTLLSNTLNDKKRAIYSFSYLEILTECAALFFVVLLAHIHLRESFTGVGIVYLEYMYVLVYFCVVYVTVNAYLVIHAELSNRRIYRLVRYRDNLLPKILFLPLFSVLALMISLRFF